MIDGKKVNSTISSIDISFLNELPLLLQSGLLKDATLVANPDGSFSTVITFLDGSSATHNNGLTSVDYVLAAA